MLTESSVMLFWLSCAVLSAIWRDEYLTSAVRTSLVLTAEVKYSSRKITLKTARDGEKSGLWKHNGVLCEFGKIRKTGKMCHVMSIDE